tara:strand:- start:2649 stop:2936 length:288 start_codon:yes stop_codon:yes gene_type:complete
MSSLERKLKRTKAKKFKKELKKTMGGQLDLFGLLPDHCLTCNKGFDKTNKEHAINWKVIVREEQKRVSLYCPECWTSAEELLKEIAGEKNEPTES